MPERVAQRSPQGIPPEADLLFSTARVRVGPEVAERIRAATRKDVNWIALIQMALQHETTALLYRNLQLICPGSVPNGVLEPLAARFEAQAAEAHGRAEELVRILRALEDHGLFAVAYKGLMLAQRLYGDLSLREFSDFSDLDIMIHERDLAKARGVILTQGYREDAQGEREMIFYGGRDGRRTLELHWRFMTKSSRIPDDPERFFQCVEKIQLAGATVRSLPLEIYFLILCLHATKHKWRKLKLICDIAETLGSRDVDWKYVVREAENLGLRRMLAVGILLAENPLGAECPAGLARLLKIDRAARSLAAECRQNLLREPDDTWRLHAEFRFLLKMRERLSDKAAMFLWEWMWPKTMPDKDDRQFVLLPESLSVLYYFLRPVRLAWKEIAERP